MGRSVDSIIFRNFLALVSLYLAANVVLRWLRWPLFHGYGAYGWEQPGLHGLAVAVLVCVVPVFALFASLAGVFGRMVDSRGKTVLALVVIYLGLLCIEVDMSWMQMSRRHVGVAEVSVFVMAGFGQTFGVGRDDVVRFASLCAAHAVAMTLMYMASRWAPSWFLRPLRRSVAVPGLAALGVLLVVSAFLMGSARANGNRQISELAIAHPFRLGFFDTLYMRFSDHGRFINAINDTYRGMQPLPHVRNMALASAARPLGSADHDVVVIVMEGVSKNHVDVLTSLDRTRRESIEAESHYSTGDATHYGILGLVFGEPVLFYGKDPRRESAALDLFNAAGYETRRFGKDISTFGDIDQYTGNFSSPPFDAGDDWSMLEEVKKFVAAGGSRKLALVYYEGTHWPYRHGPAYRNFQPEVPEDFDYSAWNAADSRQRVVNRYRNSLSELNAWLAELLGSMDLDRTILVVTSDHGQEMYEHGRVSHAGGLWNGQIEVPFFLRMPGASRGGIRAVTSHADVLPACAHWLGLDAGDAGSTRPREWNFAIAAHNNHTATPVEWVFVDDAYKIFFRLGAHGAFHVTGVSSRDDRMISGEPMGPGTALHRSLAAMRGAEARFASRNERSTHAR